MNLQVNPYRRLTALGTRRRQGYGEASSAVHLDQHCKGILRDTTLAEYDAPGAAGWKLLSVTVVRAALNRNHNEPTGLDILESG